MSHLALSWSAGPLFGVIQRLVIAPPCFPAAQGVLEFAGGAVRRSDI